MWSNTVAQMEFARRLDSMQGHERALVKRIFINHKRLEFMTVTPLYAMIVFGLLISFSLTGLCWTFLGAWPFIAAPAIAILWSCYCRLFWKREIEPKRSHLKTRLRLMIASNVGGDEAYELIRELFPESISNAGELFED